MENNFNYGLSWDDDIQAVAPEAYGTMQGTATAPSDSQFAYQPTTQWGRETLSDAPPEMKTVDMGLGESSLYQPTTQFGEEGLDPSEQQKRDYLESYYQTKQDASAEYRAGEKRYRYADPGDDRSRVVNTLLAAAGTLFMVGMPAAAIFVGAKTWLDQGNQQHRFKQIDYLEKEGYMPEMIDQWVATGDNRFLAEGKKKRFENLSNGMTWDNYEKKFVEKPQDEVVKYRSYTDKSGVKWDLRLNKDGTDYRDPTTGEPELRATDERTDDQRKGESGKSNKVITDRIDLGDRVRVYYADGRTEDIDKGTKPGISTTKAAPSEVKSYNEDRRLIQELSSPSRIENVLNTFKDKDGNWSTEDLGFTHYAMPGGQEGKAPMGADTMTAALGGEARKKFSAANNLNAMQENFGIAEARALGASGINTQAEADRFAKQMPRVDYSSQENFINSLQRIEDYTKKWNEDRLKQAQSRVDDYEFRYGTNSQAPRSQAPSSESPAPAKAPEKRDTRPLEEAKVRAEVGVQRGKYESFEVIDGKVWVQKPGTSGTEQSHWEVLN